MWLRPALLVPALPFRDHTEIISEGLPLLKNLLVIFFLVLRPFFAIIGPIINSTLRLPLSISYASEPLRSDKKTLSLFSPPFSNFCVRRLSSNHHSAPLPLPFLLAFLFYGGAGQSPVRNFWHAVLTRLFGFHLAPSSGQLKPELFFFLNSPFSDFSLPLPLRLRGFLF